MTHASFTTKLVPQMSAPKPNSQKTPHLKTQSQILDELTRLAPIKGKLQHCIAVYRAQDSSSSHFYSFQGSFSKPLHFSKLLFGEAILLHKSTWQSTLSLFVMYLIAGKAMQTENSFIENKHCPGSGQDRANFCSSQEGA